MPRDLHRGAGCLFIHWLANCGSVYGFDLPCPRNPLRNRLFGGGDLRRHHTQTSTAMDTLDNIHINAMRAHESGRDILQIPMVHLCVKVMPRRSVGCCAHARESAADRRGV
jgi:hypothetical protein